MDHAGRRARVADRLADLRADALLVASRPDVRYLSGFTGSSGAILLGSDGGAVLCTDGRYLGQAAAEAPGVGVHRVARDPVVAAGALAAERALSRLVFDASIAYATFGDLAEAAARVELVAATGIVERERLVKEPEERDALARAQACTDDAFARVLDLLRPGVTEREVALELETAMRRGGADDRAFGSIVAFGEHGAEPHHAPCARPLGAGELATMDFGAVVDGYHADMTRTVALGDPGVDLRRVHAVVLEAHLRGIETLAPGVPAGEVEGAVHAVVSAAGLEEGWLHPAGHAVGLEIHEPPILRAGEPTAIPAGAVITIEPGVYLAGRGGVRIEDAVEVTVAGPRPLPDSPKELLVL